MAQPGFTHALLPLKIGQPAVEYRLITLAEAISRENTSRLELQQAADVSVRDDGVLRDRFGCRVGHLVAFLCPDCQAVHVGLWFNAWYFPRWLTCPACCRQFTPGQYTQVLLR